MVKTINIHSAWMRFYPSRGMQFRFWFEVAMRVNRKKLNSTNFKKIQVICKEVDNEFKQRGI